MLAWGRQLDIRVVRDGTRVDDPTGPLTPDQVAGYLAKYATKDATSLRTPGAPRPHLQRLAVYTGDELDRLEKLTIPSSTPAPARKRASKPRTGTVQKRSVQKRTAKKAAAPKAAAPKGAEPKG